MMQARLSDPTVVSLPPKARKGRLVQCIPKCRNRPGADARTVPDVRVAVLVKQIPAPSAFKMEDARVVREGVALEVNAYCRRANAKAVEEEAKNMGVWEQSARFWSFPALYPLRRPPVSRRQKS